MHAETRISESTTAARSAQPPPREATFAGTFSGLALPWHKASREIRPGLSRRVWESVARGAFARSLRAHRDRIFLTLFEQDERVLARSPWTLNVFEGADGLRFDAKLLNGLDDVQSAIASVSNGVITDVKVYYIATKTRMDNHLEVPLRVVLEADLVSISFVGWPVFPGTSITFTGPSDSTAGERDNPASRAKWEDERQAWQFRLNSL